MKSQFKINQLAAKPIELSLIHPTQGDTGIIVKMVGPHSTQFREANKKFKDTEMSEKDFVEFVASTVTGWDEDAFEMPCSHENVVAALAAPENEWIVVQVMKKFNDSLAFFQ